MKIVMFISCVQKSGHPMHKALHTHGMSEALWTLGWVLRDRLK